MCGRYWLDPDETADLLEPAVSGFDRKTWCQRASGDICPSERAPVIRAAGGGLGIMDMRWGCPSYKSSALIINARAESVFEKKMFQAGIRASRIVIPASGFYEWNPRKEKNTFRRKDSPLMYMAGFADIFDNEERFVILTTAANESMIPVHGRMPLILEKDQLDEWILDDSAVRLILGQRPVQLERRAEFEQMTLF